MVGSSERTWKVHLGVAMLEGKVAGDVGQEGRVVVDVSKGEFMVCNECVCEWRRKIMEK